MTRSNHIAVGILGRRELFVLIGAGLLVAACGTSNPPITAVADEASSAPSTIVASAATTASPTAPTHPLESSATSAPTGSVVTGTSSTPATTSTLPTEHNSSAPSTAATSSNVVVGGAHVPASEAISASDAARIAAEVNGRWLGSWRDSAGGSGTGDVAIALDPRTRTARATVAFTGPLLGSAIATQTYQVDLMSFVLASDSYAVTSPQFGRLTIVPGGATSASASATRIPDHPEIAGIDIRAARTAQRVDVSYTIRHVDGRTVTGTMAWGNGRRVAAAALPSAGTAPNPVDVQTGAFAADLLTAKALTTIFGTPFPAPTSNGGRLGYQAGIDTSNAASSTSALELDYTIYVGHSPAATAAFWRNQLQSFPAIAGTWRAAFWYDEIATLYVFATDTRALIVHLVPLGSSAGPSPAEQERLCKAVATQLVAELKSA